jgi:hypothetical protein
MKSNLHKLLSLSLTICFLGDCSALYHKGRILNPCGKKGDYCNSPSLKIWKKFYKGTGLDGISVPGVYHGTCFHEADYRDPFYPHRGVVLIDEKNGKRYFGAWFMFYPEGNPYKYLNVSALRRTMLLRLYREDHEIEWNRDHAWILLNPGMEKYYQVNYFIRKDVEDDKKMFLIGFWRGPGYRVFCELELSE